jgi:glycosyltransferase involved in cell wall biosynthesis
MMAVDASPPLVSFVMPVWLPRPAWLRDAVASVLEQEACRIELIVVDDGSPEHVDTLLKDVQDDRMHIIRVEHGGATRALNAGLRSARGDLLRFVDADDVLERRSTAHLTELMGSTYRVITYGATLSCTEELRPIRRIASDLHGRIAEDCLLGRFAVRVPAMLFPRWVVDTVGDWDTDPKFTVSYDWDYVLRCLDHAAVSGDDRVALWYRRHPQSATGDPLAGVDGARRTAARYFERHPERRGTALERQSDALVGRLAMSACRRIGDRHGYFAAMRSAATTDPVEMARQELGAAAGTVRARGRARLQRLLGPT